MAPPDDDEQDGIALADSALEAGEDAAAILGAIAIECASTEEEKALESALLSESADSLRGAIAYVIGDPDMTADPMLAAMDVVQLRTLAVWLSRAHHEGRAQALAEHGLAAA